MMKKDSWESLISAISIPKGASCRRYGRVNMNAQRRSEID